MDAFEKPYRINVEYKKYLKEKVADKTKSAE
jgi:hypothetical protein